MLKVIIEEATRGFEAGIEDEHETRCGYWGETRGAALLSMLLFDAKATRNLARGVARDCERLMATATAVADELGIDLNPNVPRAVYQATGEFGGEVARLRERVADLQRQSRA